MKFSDISGDKVLRIVPNTAIRHPFDPDARGVLFTLDSTTYLVFEDPSDGYRSNAAPILHFEGSAYELGGDVFPTYIHEMVECRHVSQSEFGDGADILELVSKETGEVVFRVGTDNIDDYYPGFVCEWNPAGLSANSKARASD